MSEKTNKDTIYIDIDDEITGVIDKVRNAGGKIVALVLPKRATVLQSVVNMKLLKRTADEANKHLVLVTSEVGLLPLAGSVGLYVASTPTSKPFIPPAPAGLNDETEDVDEPLDMANEDDELEESYDPAVAATTPVGELAGAKQPSKIAPAAIDEDIDLDNSDEALAAAPVAAAAKVKKNKKLKVPNFDSFRKKLLLAAVVLVVLIGGWVLAFIILPKATITIHTDTSTIKSNLNLTLDTAAKALDPATNTVPAVAASQQKTASQQAPATGQQNNGSKAVGQVTITNCGDDDASLPAGTTMTSSAHTFVTQSAVSVPVSNFTSPASGSKCKNDGKNTVNVTALKGGAEYNLDAGAYAISGSPAGLTAQGTQMSGGTDNITKIISQSDIDSASAKITAQDSASVKQGLQSVLQGKSLKPLPTTFVAGDPQVTTSAKAGDATDTVTVTQVTTYTMLGVKETDLKTLVSANVTKQLDKSKQSILDDGISSAKYTQANPATATSAAVAMQTTSTAGPSIDTNNIKKLSAGKKSGEIKNQIKQTPGVTEVDVTYSPFWVSIAPKNTSKITVQLDKANSGQQ